MNRFKIPDELNLKSSNKNVEWKMFKQLWMNYEIAVGLSEQDSKKRVATLLTIIGKEAVNIFNTFKWNSEEEKENITKVIEKFDEYCIPRKNLTYERYVFNTRKQNDTENIDDYVTSLKLLASNCEYGAIEESLIKDMLVLGVNDKKLRENMLLDPDLSLEKAINMSKASERTKTELSTMYENNKQENDDLYAINKSKKTRVPERKCWFCGNTHHYGRNNCPAFGKTCHNCNGKNHFSSTCKKPRSDIHEIYHEEDDQEFIIN